MTEQIAFFHKKKLLKYTRTIEENVSIEVSRAEVAWLFKNPHN